MTNDAYAREIIRAGRDLGITDRGIVIAFATVSVECDWVMYANAKVPESLALPHERVGSDGFSVGLFQQQIVKTANGYWWSDAATCMDPYKSARLFFERLKKRDYNTGDPGAHAQAIQGSAFPDRYGQRMNQAQAYFDRLTSNQENPMAVSGDPVWLEDVLREALGDRLVVHEGWKERGAGGLMGTIWGTMIHHTGNVNETVAVIRDGVQQPSGWLPGPLSQCLITPDGTCHLIAVGPCNHAGSGNWGTLTNGNRDSIGFECAYSGSGPWPQKQIITMRDATAAISKKIGKKAADSVCGHKEYAKPQGRKVDPGNMDMNWFRAEVQKDLDGFVFPGEHPPITEPPAPEPPKVKRFPDDWTDRELMLEILRQLRGPSLKGWSQLGGKSIVDFLAGK